MSGVCALNHFVEFMEQTSGLQRSLIFGCAAFLTCHLIAFTFSARLTGLQSFSQLADR